MSKIFIYVLNKNFSLDFHYKIDSINIMGKSEEFMELNH